MSQERRISPSPSIQAPRIPTLKLPQTTLATMRKVSGLGSEFGGARQGNQTWKVIKGKGKVTTRAQWSSTV
jgi:hypothetical protein